MEAGIANRALGLIAYWRGDFVRGADPLRAGARRSRPESRPEGSGTFRRRQNLRVVTPRRDHVAIGRGRTRARIDRLGNPARGRDRHRGDRRCALLEIVSGNLAWRSRGDAERGRGSGARRARTWDVQYVNEAELHSGWARGRIDDPTAGAAQVRRVLAAFVDQGVRVNLGFYSGLLAELEAETLGADSALARIDEALASRTKSNIVARSPSCIVFAAKSCSSAIPPIPLRPRKPSGPPSPSRRSKARAAPVLLASLSLAKLYQSTGRPADAHAVLAPALEGFSPTPEMPEIAEAQALLVAIEAGAHVRHE